jgi:hypothetical protein
MEGFHVVTSDDCKIGHVEAVREGHLIIEHGLLKKTKHAVPETFAYPDHAEETVRLSVSKEIVESSPKLDNGSIDTQAVAEHFGLAEATADQDLMRAGEEPADQSGATIREGDLEPELDKKDAPTGYLSDRTPGDL